MADDPRNPKLESAADGAFAFALTGLSTGFVLYFVLLLGFGLPSLIAASLAVVAGVGAGLLVASIRPLRRLFSALAQTLAFWT